MKFRLQYRKEEAATYGWDSSGITRTSSVSSTGLWASFSASSAFFLALSKRESRYSSVISFSSSDSSRDDESESESVLDEVPVVDMDLRAASSVLSKSVYFVSEYDEATPLKTHLLLFPFPCLRT